jgi:hypothetical protein
MGGEAVGRERQRRKRRKKGVMSIWCVPDVGWADESAELPD